jgi:hypothetical protein
MACFMKYNEKLDTCYENCSLYRMNDVFFMPGFFGQLNYASQEHAL